MSGMVDIGEKRVVKRVAEAEGRIKLKSSTLDAIKKGEIRKGDVLNTARTAGIMGAKSTAILIPLCHQIPLESIELDFRILEDGIVCKCKVKANYRTGVEMEALTGVILALLTIWDMTKYLEKDVNGQYPTTLIEDVKVIRKEKGD